jgi:hypothetical protein
MGEKLLEAMGIKILVPKKGLEPPHPCGYMDLNHARLPIPPLRQVDYFARPPQEAACQEEQLSILQTLPYLSNTPRQQPKRRKPTSLNCVRPLPIFPSRGRGDITAKSPQSTYNRRTVARLRSGIGIRHGQLAEDPA